MSLCTLKIIDLHNVLFLRPMPHAPDDYHMCLYVHNDDGGGTRYQVKQEGSGWIADHARTAGIFNSFLLVGMFQITTIPSGHEGRVDQQLRYYDSSLNSLPNISCRIWPPGVLKLLHEEFNGERVLKCADLSAFETEVIACGDTKAGTTLSSRQPRPVAVSGYIHG
ncbi:hypothetical protein PTNB73_06217 [Pyrenophora teres f. teres]|nr:hypothetical protein HRS9139_06437 [Pyrenophora teres f. teres]KAE8841846.1 hypothetical protein HRS9122_05972 [Pyrenophora teres f. teres]KAE8865329.1 hypothetical protein PTNB73_06217 [Pyrenophora teres f. teres]